MTDEELYQTPCVSGGLHDQLRMARYIVHRIRTTDYARKVWSHQMTEEEAKGHYDKTMANFDDLMKEVNEKPEMVDTIEKDMALGFKMPVIAQKINLG